VTNEALTGFSLSVTERGVGTMYGASALIKVTATMPVDSISAADLLQATLGGTVYESALITAHNLATNSSYELGRPSITAHLLQADTSGELVQVVLAAKSLQVLTPAKFGGRGWTATAHQFEGQTGQRFTYVCPVFGPNDDVSGDNVWGTTTYTDDSSVCAATVNYGLITIEAGGTVTIEIEPGLASYTGSTRNGTTTESYGKWSGSFVFISPSTTPTSATAAVAGTPLPMTSPPRTDSATSTSAPPRAARKTFGAPAPTPTTAPSALPQSKKG
jgi:hypothetical protein